MRIDSITIEGFRCFKDRTIIDLNDLTCFIGTNGSGKTAAMLALAKIFGITENQRKIKHSDFFIELGDKIDTAESRSLYIEVKISFPEFDSGENTQAIPQCFNQMILSEPDANPYCRIRLEASWEKSNIPEGNFEQETYWVLTDKEDPDETQKKKLLSADRNRIHLVYIPTTRNQEQQIDIISGVLYRFLNLIHWEEEIKDEIASISQKIKDSFTTQKGVTLIQSEITKFWNIFFSSRVYKTVSLSPISNDISDIISNINILFSPSDVGGDESVHMLSDGMRSLFYFTLICATFSLENTIFRSTENEIFDNETYFPPELTIFAIEEPENHLSPHYLARIVSIFRNLLCVGHSQIILSSHSPSILKRIEPEEIRFFSSDRKRTSSIKRILLPGNTSEAYKFVKEAVKAYPELYFSKAVILGEGDSEELIIPRIAAALDINIDTSFVSFVPLGGRFVNHFWRLLVQLNIPFITLLDFDKGRTGGSSGRIKYIAKQLLEMGYPEPEVLINSITIEELEEYHKKELSEEEEKAWLRQFVQFNIFFSYPIDIDFLMLEHFEKYYTEIIEPERGPIIPKATDSKYLDMVKSAISAVLKKDTKDVDNITTYPNIEYYFWYRYLFLGRGKPLSHMLALSKISNSELKDSCPPVYRELLKVLQEYLKEE